MSYPEPNDLDDIYGPGAEAADAQAAHDEEIADEIFSDIGMPENDSEKEWCYALIFKALEIGRKEVDRIDCEP